jgi:hypothetical protein
MNQAFRKRIIHVAVIAALFASIQFGTTEAFAAQALYDNFNDPSFLVRADLWRSFDNYTTGGIGSGRTDGIRVIDALLGLSATPANPKLLIAKRFVLQPGAAVGSADFDGYVMLQGANAIGIQADVSMKLCFLGTAGFVQAGLTFTAFNDGTSPAPGNQTGDIFARLTVRCSSGTNQAEIGWTVLRCSDAPCTAVRFLGTGSFGPVSVGQEYTLHVSKTGSSFTFQALGQIQIFPVPGSPVAPPRAASSGVMTRIDPTTPGNGGQFEVAATFDNVMIDQ